MKQFRVVLWLLVAGLGSYLAWATLNESTTGKRDPIRSLATAGIGGPFIAVTAKGDPITREKMLGRPHVIFFGFTNCPDICPTTLYEAGLWLNALGADGDKVDIYFVTVDPQQDTVEILGDYLGAFDPRIQGITGTPEQIAQLAKSWRVFYQKKKTDSGYTVDHTATTYLMKPNGDFFGTIAYGENNDTAVQKLKRLLVSNQEQD